MNNKAKTYHLTTTDNRKKAMIKKIYSKISSLLQGMEVAKFNDADILVIFSYTGEIVSKKLFSQIMKFQKSDKKTYVYSDYSNTMREIIRVEESVKDFGTNSMYAVLIHTGMKIEQYNQLINTNYVATSQNPEE